MPRFLQSRLVACALATALLGAHPALASDSGNESGTKESWATSRARDLTTRAQAHADAARVDDALRLLREAVSIDGTYGPAYLLLGELLIQRRDVAEAFRTYDRGIDRIAGFADGYLARAELRRRTGDVAGAIDDYQRALRLNETDAVLSRLTDAYIKRGALPAALATARRRWALARANRDAEAGRLAQLQAQALTVLVGELDPVGAGRGNDVRVLLSLLARPQ